MLDKILLYFSIIYILCFLLMCIISQFIIIKFSKKVFNILCSIFIMACCIVAFYSTDKSEGESGWDLNRYYADINAMRGKDIKFAMHNGMYKNTILTNLLFFFVSRLNNNAWLQVFSTLISGCILFYLISSINSSDTYKQSTILFYVLLYFGLIGFATTLLGVRWVMAISFCALGRQLGRNKKFGIINEFICCAIALCIHYGVIFYLFVRLISVFKNKVITLFLLFSMVIILALGKLAVNIQYFNALYNKFLEYIKISCPDIRVFIVEIVVLFVYCIGEYQISNKKTNLDGFPRNMLAATIGIIAVYHLFSRMLGLYTFTCMDDVMEIVENNKIIRFILAVVIIGLLSYQLVFMKTYWRFTI